MGKTEPTDLQVEEEELRRWKKFEDTLRGKDRDIFEKIKDYTSLHKPAGITMASPDPFKPIILSVLLEKQKEIEKLKERIKESK